MEAVVWLDPHQAGKVSSTRSTVREKQQVPAKGDEVGVGVEAQVVVQMEVEVGVQAQALRGQEKQRAVQQSQQQRATEPLTVARCVQPEQLATTTPSRMPDHRETATW